MVCFWWKSGVKGGIAGKSGSGRLEIGIHMIEKSVDDLSVALKENPLSGAICLSGSRIVAAIDDNAGKGSVNARTAGIKTISFPSCTSLKRRNGAARRFVKSCSRTLHDGGLRLGWQFVNDC
jgi:hypothetical protein